MLQWLQSKALSLLLVALLLVGGFAVLTSIKLKYTTSELEASNELLRLDREKYKALDESYTRYVNDVAAGQSELARVLQAIQDSKKETNSAINKLRLYPTTPVLDTPFPDDYLRLFRTGTTDLPAPAASGVNNKQSPMPGAG